MMFLTQMKHKLKSDHKDVYRLQVMVLIRLRSHVGCQITDKTYNKGVHANLIGC